MSKAIIKNFVKEIKVDMLYSLAECIMRGKNNKYFFIDGKQINSLNEFVNKVNKNAKVYEEENLDNFTKSMYYAFISLKNNVQVVVIISNFDELISNLNVSKEEFKKVLLIILKMYEKDNEDKKFIKKSLDFYLCPDEIDFEDLDEHLDKIKKSKKSLTRKN